MSLAESYLFVERDDQLHELCARLSRADWLTVDTEFLRERTYYPQLCLVQIASPDEVACVDPQKVSSLDPLVGLFANPDILKVFHAARQDLELFWHSHRCLPAPIFDTQIAAPLLGYPEQMGYAALVKARLGIEIDKSETRTDWSRRPLTASQLDYAAADVRHLAELFPALRDDLARRGRLDWLREDFAELIDPAAYENHPEQAWRRLRGLPPPVIERYGEQLVALLDAARGRPPEPLPDAERPETLSEDQEAAVDVLSGVLRQLAAVQDLNPASIASRKDLQNLMRGARADSPLLHGWRRGVAGDQLIDVLEGRCRVHIRPEGLVIEC